MSDGRGFSTRAIHEGEQPKGIVEEPISTPIWLTSDYFYEGLEHYADVVNERRPGFVYGRYGNPTHVALHRVLASLEGAEAAWSFASGMAALHVAITALVKTGGHVVAQRTVYGGTLSLLKEVLPDYGIQTTFTEMEAAAVAAALRPTTGAVLVETLANPTFRVADVRGIADVCAEAEIPLVVDNTVATPWLYRPIEALPCETLVMHSTSKYIGGHSDLIGGAVACSAGRMERIRFLAMEQGGTAGAFDAWLALRGVQTLGLRMERQSATALALARSLFDHPKASRVGYSGLPQHPDHERAVDLFGERGFGAMLSFTLTGGYEAASRACAALQVARVGSSFGGLNTEVTHPGTTSHRQFSAEERVAAGIGDGLIRCSVGGEDPDDLIADFAQALEKA